MTHDRDNTEAARDSNWHRILRQRECARRRQDPEVVRQFEAQRADYVMCGLPFIRAQEIAAIGTGVSVGDVVIMAEGEPDLREWPDPLPRHPRGSQGGANAFEARRQWLVTHGASDAAAYHVAELETYGFADDRAEDKDLQSE